MKLGSLQKAVLSFSLLTAPSCRQTPSNDARSARDATSSASPETSASTCARNASLESRYPRLWAELTRTTPSERTRNNPLVCSPYGSLANILEDVYHDRKPAIIAIGEHHIVDGPSLLGIFARDLLPTLAGWRYRDLVLEDWPTDIENFDAWLQQLSRHPRTQARIADLRELAKQARDLGVSIHRGGAPFALQISGNLQAIAAANRDNSAHAIRELRGEGKRVLFFGGSVHVMQADDVYATPASDAYSLRQRLGGETYETIHLVRPELLMERWANGGDADLRRALNALSPFTPARGLYHRVFREDRAGTHYFLIP